MQKIAEGVKGLIMKEGKFLVLTKPNYEPDLPGGRVEDGEGFKDSLQREIIEETGLVVDILGTISNWSFIKKPGILVTGVTYCCNYLKGKVTLSNEHTDYSWAGINKIDRFVFEKYIKGSGLSTRNLIGRHTIGNLREIFLGKKLDTFPQRLNG